MGLAESVTSSLPFRSTGADRVRLHVRLLAGVLHEDVLDVADVEADALVLLLAGRAAVGAATAFARRSSFLRVRRLRRRRTRWSRRRRASCCRSRPPSASRSARAEVPRTPRSERCRTADQSMHACHVSGDGAFIAQRYSRREISASHCSCTRVAGRPCAALFISRAARLGVRRREPGRRTVMSMYRSSISVHSARVTLPLHAADGRRGRAEAATGPRDSRAECNSEAATIARNRG